MAESKQKWRTDRNRRECQVFDCPLARTGPGKPSQQSRERQMNSLIYLVGLIVIVLAILSFFGLS